MKFKICLILTVLLEKSQGSFIYLFIVNFMKMAVNKFFYRAAGKTVKY